MAYKISIGFDHNATDAIDAVTCAKWLKEHGNFTLAMAALKAYRHLQAAASNTYVVEHARELLTPPYGLIVWSEKIRDPYEVEREEREAHHTAQQERLALAQQGDPHAALEFCKHFQPYHYACSGGFA